MPEQDQPKPPAGLTEKEARAYGRLELYRSRATADDYVGAVHALDPDAALELAGALEELGERRRLDTALRLGSPAVRPLSDVERADELGRDLDHALAAGGLTEPELAGLTCAYVALRRLANDTVPDSEPDPAIAANAVRLTHLRDAANDVVREANALPGDYWHDTPVLGPLRVALFALAQELDA